VAHAVQVFAVPLLVVVRQADERQAQADTLVSWFVAR